MRQKTCASAVQPRRSSRCGQSVGTLTKFDRCPHRMFCHSWLIIGLPVFSCGGKWGVGMKDNRLHRIQSGVGRQARHLDIAKAVEGKPGLIVLNPRSCKDEVVGGLCRAKVVGIQRAVGDSAPRQSAAAHRFPPVLVHAASRLPPGSAQSHRYKCPALGLVIAFALKKFFHAHWRKELCNDRRLFRDDHLGWLPVGGRKRRRVPAWLFAALS